MQPGMAPPMMPGMQPGMMAQPGMAPQSCFLHCPERNRNMQCSDNLDARNSENKGHWERFEVTFHSPTSVSFKSHKNTYLKAIPDGSARFDASAIGEWERFNIIP